MQRQLGWTLGLFLLAGLLLAGAASHRQAPLVGASRVGEQVERLESLVAHHPKDRDASIRLCRAYLDRGLPGAALSVIHHAPASVRTDPMMRHLWAEALLRGGDALQARDVERKVLEACRREKCDPWLDASARYRLMFLEALGEQGVKDYRKMPVSTVRAFERMPLAWVRVESPRR